MCKGPSIHSLIHLYKRCVSKILENSQKVVVMDEWSHLNYNVSSLKRSLKDQAFIALFTSTRGVYQKFSEFLKNCMYQEFYNFSITILENSQTVYDFCDKYVISLIVHYCDCESLYNSFNREFYKPYKYITILCCKQSCNGL